jgi:hypothetical protein
VLREPALSSASAVIIAGSAHAPALRRRLEQDLTIVVFCESESLDALRLIQANPPKVLALDPAIVKTARGALIVSLVKEHAGVDIRVLTLDEAGLPVLLVAHDMPLHAASKPLEACGTRSAKRFAMKPDVEVVVDGERSRLVNLSINGAQLLVPARVQPRQGVRLTLVDAVFEQRFRARVAWATVELAQSAVEYRAGISFVDPDASAIEAFCRRNAVRA